MSSVLDKIKKVWRSVGPGVITGASDDDPSGIITYMAAGAKIGLAGMWTMLFTLPLMVVMQEMSARIGIASSCGLTGNIKRYYSTALLVFLSTLIIVSNVFNIGADVYAMAAAVDLITPGGTLFWSFLIVVLILSIIVILPYKKIVSIFKWLSITLFAYVFTGLIVIDNWGEVFKSLVIPNISFDREHLLILVALIGTTLSPYLAFWQASEEAEETRIRESGEQEKVMVCKFRSVTRKDVNRSVLNTRIGMFFSNFIGFFIIALASVVIYAHGATNIESIAGAANALRPLAGEYAFLLFTLGVIGAGLLAIPILAGSSAYVLSELFGWSSGLNKPFSKAKEFYLVIIIATVLGLAIPLFGISPIKALIWTSIIHGIVAPFLIAALIHMANNPKIVGPNVNSKRANVAAYIALALTSIALLIFIIAHTPLFN